MQDKRHFYKAALAKVSKDASAELAFIEARRSPTFVKPPDRVNDTSRFPERRLDEFDKMLEKLENPLVSTDKIRKRKRNRTLSKATKQ